MLNQTISVKDIDISNIKFGSPKKHNSDEDYDTSYYTIQLLYQERNFIIQTPFMYVKESVKINENKHQLYISFNDMDTNQKIKEFYDIIEMLEEKILSEVVSKNWLRYINNISSNETIARMMLHHTIHHDIPNYENEYYKKNEEIIYEPYMKVDIPMYNDVCKIDCITMTKKTIKFEDIKDNINDSLTCLLVQPTDIVFTHRGFGCRWKVHAARFDLNDDVVNKITEINKRNRVLKEELQKNEFLKKKLQKQLRMKDAKLNM